MDDDFKKKDEEEELNGLRDFGAPDGDDLDDEELLDEEDVPEGFHDAEDDKTY